MSGPGFVEPQLATLTDDAVEGDEWIFERKLDGMRLVVVRDGDRVALWSRNRIDRCDRFPELADAIGSIGPERIVMDGEVVAFEGRRTSFSRLQQRFSDRATDDGRRAVAVKLYLFDLMHLDGDDVRELPLRERKARLRSAIDFDDPLRFCPHRLARGPELWNDACERGWEGLIAKRADAPYRSGRSTDWLKLKCVARQELVVAGFTEPEGSRQGFGALVLGHHDDDGRLIHAGRVGTGFDDETLRRLRSMLDERERATSPFDDGPDDRETHWVTPDLVAEIGFTEWTDDGKLRHPRFLGLRDDKPASEVVRERPA